MQVCWTANSSDMSKTLSGLSRGIVIDDFGNRRERNLYDLAVGALDLDAWRRQRLRRFHAAHDAADAVASLRHDLNIAFAIKWLKRCEGPGDFHLRISLLNQMFDRLSDFSVFSVSPWLVPTRNRFTTKTRGSLGI